MRTLKALFSTLAMGALTVALAATVSAASVENGVVSLTTNDYTTSDGQMTVVIVPADKWNASTPTFTADDIIYINQFDKSEAASVLGNMGTKSFDEATKYVVLIGGENAAEIQDDVTIGGAKPVYVGDVNDTGVVDESDLVTLSDYIANPTTNALKNYDCLDAADTNATGVVDESDLVTLSDYIANPTTNAFTYTYISDKPADKHVPQN